MWGRVGRGFGAWSWPGSSKRDGCAQAMSKTRRKGLVGGVGLLVSGVVLLAVGGSLWESAWCLIFICPGVVLVLVGPGFVVASVGKGARKREEQAARRRIASYRGALTEAVNDVRKKHGLRPLGRVKFLDEIATGHATHMAHQKRCSHDRIGDRREMIRNGAGLEYVAENVIMYPTKEWNARVAKKVVETWMKSEGHRWNILDERYTRTGIGWRLRNGYFYAVQIFTE